MENTRVDLTLVSLVMGRAVRQTMAEEACVACCRVETKQLPPWCSGQPGQTGRKDVEDVCGHGDG